jgi:hypothetical protein
LLESLDDDGVIGEAVVAQRLAASVETDAAKKLAFERDAFTNYVAAREMPSPISLPPGWKGMP